MRQASLIALVLAACAQTLEQAQPEPDDLAGAAETYCKLHPDLPCGKVYQFDTPADDPLGLIEMCVPQPYTDPVTMAPRPTLEEAETMFGASMLSTDPRFDRANLCWWCCGPGCTRGCNSYSGCWCGPTL